MTLPNSLPEFRRSFFGPSADAARDAASSWLRNFDAHGPFEIHDISTTDDGSRFIATVAYSEATIPITRREKMKEEIPAKPSNANRRAMRLALARFGPIGSVVRSALQLEKQTAAGPQLSQAAPIR